MISTFSALTSPAAWAAASTGRTGSKTSPSIDTRGPTASAARTRCPASRFEMLKLDVNTRRIVP